MSYHDQQKVSNTAHFSWRAASSHLLCDQQQVSEIGHFCEVVAIFPWPTESEWHWMFLWNASLTHLSFNQQQVCGLKITLWPSQHIPFYNQQGVSDIALPLKGTLTFFSSFYQQFVGDIAYFFERHSCHIFCHNKQGVSDVANVLNSGLRSAFPWPTGSEWFYSQNEISSLPFL